MESRLDVVVVGAGFTGLSTGARLRQSPGVTFAILEQGGGVGHFWTGTYDRLHLHSPGHDLPHDGGLRASMPLLLKRDEVVGYFQGYARHHQLEPHLRFGTRVEQIHGEEGEHPWRIETSAGELRARYVVVGTSVNRLPRQPRLEGADVFGGRLMHSAAYRNPSSFAGRSVLVVGSGNSGAELSLDLVEGGARAVSMWVRAPRHFIPLSRTLTMYRVAQALGQMSEKKQAATHALTRGTPAFDREVRLRDMPLKLLSVDLTRFGIRKPATGPLHGIMYEERLPVMDVGAIERIRDGSIRVIDGNVRAIRGLTSRGVQFSDVEEAFDDIILATGYEPGLEHLLADKELLGPSHGRPWWPRTDGRCRSTVRPAMFFPGFDVTPLGGVSLGRWGWEIGGIIAGELQG